MAHDVFISHSSKDKTTADTVCAVLEAKGIRCWVAPRDIRPGEDWGEAIINALHGCRVMVLIFSQHANQSPQIKREVNRAVDRAIPIIPFRIENVMPTGSIEYSISTAHWLDAFTPPLESHIEYLARSIEVLSTRPVLGEEPSPDGRADVPQEAMTSEVSPPGPAISPRVEFPPSASLPPSSSRKGWLIGWALAIVVLLFGALCYCIGMIEDEKARQAEIAKHFGAGKPASGQVQSEPDTQKTDALSATASATPPTAAATGPAAGKAWTNSLGMKFVPAGTDGVLFGIWDVRVKDYGGFAKETGDPWPNPPFDQTENDPAVMVSWDDAHAFCGWLTKKEQTEARLGTNQEYRLPTDAEWSRAAGLYESAGGTPAEKSDKIRGVYPWGTEWPPPHGAGNYPEGLTHDGFANTSPVGSFAANRYGLYDMGGNVWQWCEDQYNGVTRVARGASWYIGSAGSLLSSFRTGFYPTDRTGSAGFRVVVVVNASAASSAP